MVHNYLVMVCSCCGEDKEIKSNGLCNACYLRDYRNNNPEWVEQHRELMRVKTFERNTVSKFKKILSLGGACDSCGEKNFFLLKIDYLDHNPNNKVDNNLLVLCRNCFYLRNLKRLTSDLVIDWVVNNTDTKVNSF